MCASAHAHAHTTYITHPCVAGISAAIPDPGMVGLDMDICIWMGSKGRAVQQNQNQVSEHKSKDY